MNVRRWFWGTIFLGLGLFSINTFPILAMGRTLDQTEVNTALLGMIAIWAVGFLIVCSDYLYKIDSKKPDVFKPESPNTKT